MFWYYHTYILQINLLSSAINIVKKVSLYGRSFTIQYWFLLSLCCLLTNVSMLFDLQLSAKLSRKMVNLERGGSTP
jgi:hypothetical protein